MDATFVDDEALVLLARTAAELDRAIDVTLETLFAFFSAASTWTST